MTPFITSVNVQLAAHDVDGLSDNIDPAIAAISVILIFIAIAVILTKTFVMRKKNGSTGCRSQ